MNGMMRSAAAEVALLALVALEEGRLLDLPVLGLLVVVAQLLLELPRDPAVALQDQVLGPLVYQVQVQVLLEGHCVLLELRRHVVRVVLHRREDLLYLVVYLAQRLRQRRVLHHHVVPALQLVELEHAGQVLDARLDVDLDLVDPLALELDALMAVGDHQRVLLVLVHELAGEGLICALVAQPVQLVRQPLLLLLQLVDLLLVVVPQRLQRARGLGLGLELLDYVVGIIHASHLLQLPEGLRVVVQLLLRQDVVLLYWLHFLL
jgi:hypothetical protein